MNVNQRSVQLVGYARGRHSTLQSLGLAVLCARRRTPPPSRPLSPPGGRILQYKTPDGVPVDLGAEFVHGSKSNILFDMAQEQQWPMHHVFDIDDPEDMGQQAVVLGGKLSYFDEQVWGADAPKAGLASPVHFCGQ